MSHDRDDNPIIRELRKVQDTYRDALPWSRPCALCLWVTEPRGLQLVEAFVLTEDTPDAQFTDFFLTFTGGAAGAKDYPGALATELQAQFAAARETLQQQQANPALWETVATPTTLRDFLLHVHAVTADFRGPESRTVVFLHPQEAYEEAAWVHMLRETLRAGLPPDLTLMLHTTDGSGLEHALAGKRELGVVTLRPDLAIQRMTEAAAGAPAAREPDERFRRYFVEVAQYGSRGQYVPMRKSARKALKVCQQEPGWEHLVVTVHASVGSHLLRNASTRAEALSCFQRAHRAAVAAVGAGNPNGKALLLQALRFEGSALVHLANYRDGTEKYRAMAAEAAAQENPLLELEGWRMAGFCADRDGDKKSAWHLNLRGLELAERMDRSLIPQSQLPLLGLDLLRLAAPVKGHSAERDARFRLDRLLGPGWEARTQSTLNVSR